MGPYVRYVSDNLWFKVGKALMGTDGRAIRALLAYLGSDLHQVIASMVVLLAAQTIAAFLV